MVTVPDDPSFFHGKRRFLNNRTFHQIAEIFQRINLIVQIFQKGTLHIPHDTADMGQHGKRCLKSCQIPWVGRLIGDLSYQTLQIVDGGEILPDFLSGNRLL